MATAAGPKFKGGSSLIPFCFVCGLFGGAVAERTTCTAS
jgi:hypothetical protein